jgi:hypothetical protein
MKKIAETNSEELKCDHCNHTFVRAGSLLKHICEKKRRWLDRDKVTNRIAFNAWLKFYKSVQPSRKKLAYTDFSSSPYYIGFIKYGNYCVDVGVVNPIEYIDYLIGAQVALDNWTSDKVYSKYLISYLRSENELDAVRRSIENMMKIAESESIELRDVFRYASSNKICHLICSGKISPWILYQCKTGQEFLSKLNDDQRGVIYEYIDPERWTIKFTRAKEEVKMVGEIISEIGGL